MKIDVVYSKTLIQAYDIASAPLPLFLIFFYINTAEFLFCCPFLLNIFFPDFYYTC